VAIELTKKHRVFLGIQQCIAFIFFPLLYCLLVFWMRVVQGYKIKQLASIRRQFKQVKKSIDGPLLICPNHLTFIDSLILAWAFSNPWNYFCHFKSFAWNLPKRAHVAESKLYQVICYVGKCLLIASENDEAKLSMQKSQYLLEHGHYIMVFPEGTRSKTGRINTETFVYGVGGMVAHAANLPVLMVYLRGDKQQAKSKMPAKGDSFSITMELTYPTTDKKGLRANRDLSQQLIQSLCGMETSYFASNDR